jgi:hypothetical protein
MPCLHSFTSAKPFTNGLIPRNASAVFSVSLPGVNQSGIQKSPSGGESASLLTSNTISLWLWLMVSGIFNTSFPTASLITVDFTHPFDMVSWLVGSQVSMHKYPSRRKNPPVTCSVSSRLPKLPGHQSHLLSPSHRHQTFDAS